VIAGEVRFTIDVRAGESPRRDRARRRSWPKSPPSLRGAGWCSTIA
jgi:hypothetical protein